MPTNPFLELPFINFRDIKIVKKRNVKNHDLYIITSVFYIQEHVTLFWDI